MSQSCDHYRRGCALVAPHCVKVFPCLVRHNKIAICGSVLQKRSVERLSCLHCGHIGPSSATCCQQRHAEFGKRRACSVCKVFPHDKDMWHFDDGGTCRLGKRDDYQQCGEYIRRFNDLPAAVLPSEAEDQECGRAVDRVASVLRGLSTMISVDRVHKGGSFGRKTSVRGRFDVDLVVFANDFDASKKDVIERVAAALQPHAQGQLEVKPHFDMVQLQVAGVEMDVLLVRNLASSSGAAVPADKPAAQYAALVAPLFRKTADEIERMASAPPDRAREQGVVEAHTRFMAEQHKTANEAVRLFKAWVKCGLAERDLLSPSKLPSVALELIALAAYQQELRAEQEGSHEFRTIAPSRSLLLRTFLRALSLSSQLLQPDCPVIMVAAGPGVGYSREQGMRFRRCWGAEGPFIIHPIDPTCNVARNLIPRRPPWDWAGLAKHAGVLLSVVQHCSMQVLLGESTFGAALYRLRHDIGREQQ